MRTGKYIIAVFAILLALGAGFCVGVRYRAEFYIWLFYEPYLEQYEQVRTLKKEIKQMKKECVSWKHNT